MLIISIIAVCLLIVVISFRSLHNRNDGDSVCRGRLTDQQYLEHMIPHHQVAIDMSEAHVRTSTNPQLQEIMRKLIWNQKREISMMHEISLTTNGEHGMSEPKGMDLGYKPIPMGAYVKPNTPELSQTFCDPHFFDPEGHSRHMAHVNITDRAYIEHMIPHHEVAVDMSKVLLENTTNDHMIDLAHRIIRSQQAEIALLHSMLHGRTFSQSSVLVN